MSAVKVCGLTRSTTDTHGPALTGWSVFLSAGVQPVPLQTITNENPAGPSLGTIPQARFLLSMIHMLSLKHGSNSLSLLLNSGLLALTQTVLRLIGGFRRLHSSVALHLF